MGTGRRGKNLIRTGVYALVNYITRKVYIGSTSTSLVARWQSHRKALQDGKHGNRYLQAAWNKYGEKAFEFRVLIRCSPKECLVLEQRWIDITKSYEPRYGYNLSPTAASSLGVKLSEETRARISLSKKGVFVGRKMSEQACKKMSVSMQGNVNGAGNKGRKLSWEKRQKLIKDLVGNRYGRLTVVKFHDLKPHARWECLCDCGKKTVCYAGNLKRGISTSCGCALTELLIRRNKAGIGRKLSTDHKSKISAGLIGNQNAFGRCGRGASVC